MAENGILDYQGMNQAIYRGATSNIIVDTQSMSIEIGAGNSSHTSNLHIECDHAANVASIQLNSNVVTEFSRSKKLIKYPRVAMTQDDESSTTGYVADASTEESINTGPWKAFNGDGGAWETTPRRFNQNTGDWDGTTTTPYAISLVGSDTIYGEWVELKIPNKIQLHTCRIAPMTNSTYPNLGKHRSPRDGYILGRVGATGNWTVLKSWSGLIGGWEDLVLRDFDIENQLEYYDYFRVVWTAINGNNNYSVNAGYGYASAGEIEFLGIPEYDPEAHGTDVTVKSYPNVPNTDWLEVYYDGQDYTSVQTTVDNKTGVSTYDATANGGVGFDATQKAFTFDAASSQYLSSSTPVDGNYIHSISIWFKGTNLTPAAGDTLMWIGDNVNNERIEIYLESDKINYSFKTNDVVADIPLLNNRWYHLTVTYNGVAGVSGREIYLDGVKQPTTHTGNSAVLAVDNNTLNLGGFSGTSTTYMFSGSIANFRLFNRALTTDEIYQLYAYQKEYFGHGDLSMTLKAGRLGIGTSEPRAALDVRGDVLIQSMISHVNGFYEEGTWVPIIYGSTSGKKTPTTTNAGWWVRVGNLVTIGGTVGWSGGDNISGMVKIGYLPYKSMNRSNYRAAMNFGVSSSGISTPSGQNVIRLVLDPGQDGIYLTVSNEYRSTNLNYDHYPTIGASGVIYGLGGTYRI